MAVFQYITAGCLVSGLPAEIHGQFLAVRTFERGTTEPAIKVAGTVWAQTNYALPSGGTAERWVRWTGSAYGLLLDPAHPQLNAGGTVPLAANLNANGQKVVGLAAGTANGEAVRFEQTMLLSGANAMAANLNLGGYTITGWGAALNMNAQRIENLAAPTADNHAARRIDALLAAPQRISGTTFPGGTGNLAVNIELGFVPVYLNLRVGNITYIGGTAHDGSAPTVDVPEVLATGIDLGGGNTARLEVTRRNGSPVTGVTVSLVRTAGSSNIASGIRMSGMAWR
ncbi:MAG: hypothetical protein IOD15_15375 [Phycisphaerales bacterium]|nr:hypothetical protein [Phycisphaerales bacterium]